MSHTAIPLRIAATFLVAALSLTRIAAEDLDGLRLDQIQVIGTHNSYHLAPDSVAMGLMRAVVPKEADANDYSHATLTEQLQRIGVRQLELDLFLDPAGKLYRQP